MSSLNTFGFNVRRKRNHDTETSMISRPDKLSPSTDTSSPTPTLPFAATSPQSMNTLTQPAKPMVRSLLKHSTTKSKSTQLPSTKVPKQPTLLHFFANTTPSISTTPSTEGFANTTITQSQDDEEDHTSLIRHQQQQQQLHPPPTKQCHQVIDEENQLCCVRRTITSVDLLQALEEAFAVSTYGDMNDDSDNTMLPDEQQEQQQRNRPDTTVPLLQVKPNKVIYPPPPFKMMDCSNNNDEDKDNSAIISQRRRRSLENEQVNKRPCSTTFSEGKQQQAYSFMDEFDTEQQDDIEIKTVRHCLSSVEMASLLLDIANEFMTFDNNNWCNSYLDHRGD